MLECLSHLLDEQAEVLLVGPFPAPDSFKGWVFPIYVDPINAKVSNKMDRTLYE